MSDREVIVPAAMRRIYEEYGYAPALRVGNLVFVAGQVGRTADLDVIVDPEAQFTAAWENCRIVLAAAGCGFEDVVDLTTYVVDMPVHMPLFRVVKVRHFPQRTCPWTAIGVSALSRPGLLAEIKMTALLPDAASGGTPSSGTA